ncbi:sialomucin core protein 24-like [Saccostrea echinata]|uniref:sialomucin core protein 24-like n=1 Tax=Saccostrea echinata TaxID=191078 RepID=UPI002A81DA8D|nr:sialomucin core protein 24-like [Saccostrea echinata]
MNRFIHFGIGVVLLVLVCLTSCRGDAADPVTTQKPPETSETPDIQVGGCNASVTYDTCCNNTGCSWIECLNASGSVIHTGCHNLSDPADRKIAVDDCKVNDTVIDQRNTCTPPPETTTPTPSTTTVTQPTTATPTPAETCQNYTTQEDCCGAKGLALKCLYVNCTTKENPKGTARCLNSTNKASLCTPASQVICDSNQTTTTVAPTTTTAVPTTTGGSTSTTSKAPPTTQAPHTGTTPHGQHFDGASFFGGMILMAGLFVIAFFAIKFYRARKDRSYRTL